MRKSQVSSLKSQVPSAKFQTLSFKLLTACDLRLVACCCIFFTFCGSRFLNAEEFTLLEKNTNKVSSKNINHEGGLIPPSAHSVKENPLTGFIYDSHGKKDPFSPPVIRAVEKADVELLTGVKLEGIIWDEKNPIAIVNDKVVGIGDEITGAKIVEITENEVVFDIQGQRVKLKLRIIEEGEI